MYWQNYHQFGLKEIETVQNERHLCHLYFHRQEIERENYSLQIQAISQGKERQDDPDPGTKAQKGEPRDTGLDTEQCVFVLGKFLLDGSGSFPLK